MRRKSKIDKVERTSPDLAREHIAQLKDIFPECVTEGGVDFDRLKATLGEDTDSRPERYSFTWAGKRDAVRILQAPTPATLIPDPKESVDFEKTKNIFIEGDNLEVLKLLYKSYFGRVKMIYIDPPYNTGNDFIYPDNYTDPLDTYLKLTGQKDSEGTVLTSNPETNGRYHSAWLTMMYPRLFLARQMLTEDGLIFISINDYEVDNLRIVMDGVFGEENFLGQIVRQTVKGGTGPAARLRNTHDYILIYTRDKNQSEIKGEKVEAEPLDLADEKGPYRKGRELNKWGAGSRREDSPGMYYPIPGPNGKNVYPIRNDGTEGRWRWGKKKLLKIVADGDVIFEPRGDGTYIVYEKIRSTDSRRKTYSTLITDFGTNAEGTEDLKEIFDGKCPMDFPKPVSLIQHLLEIGTDSGDIILDFFAGSCSTADAALLCGNENGGARQYIMVQLPEPVKKDSVADQLHFKTISDIGKERIRRVIKKMKSEKQGKLDLKERKEPEDLGFRVFKLAASNYKRWKGVEAHDAAALEKQMEAFTDPLVDKWKADNVIWEVAIKEGYSLSSQVEKMASIKCNIVYMVTDPEREQHFRICLDDKIKPEIVKALGLKKEDLFVCRDVALYDELAANLALQCRVKTI